MPSTTFDAKNVNFSLGADRQGKTTIHMHYSASEDHVGQVGIVTPACVTNWPRVTGDGNFGTMWGPTDVSKAKFTLDLTDSQINGVTNAQWAQYAELLDAIDERLLDFVQSNQLKILGRKNLAREEIKMLQIRSVRPKYDKQSGTLTGHSVQFSAQKFAWDGTGGRFPRVINVCDHSGQVVADGGVNPGDVVAATTFVNQVYTGVGGDKFGIHWSMEDVQVVCQRTKLAQRSDVPAFGCAQYDFAMPYVAPDYTAQFSEPMGVN